MYIESLHVYGFKCFGKAVLHLRHPGEGGTSTDGGAAPDNVNLILGDNGGGKSSVLRAAAIGILAPALLESGFVPYRLVRRPDGDHALLKVIGRPQKVDRTDETSLPDELTLLARIDRRKRGSLDRLHTESTPDTPIERLIFDDYSPAFFVVGYGATRRVETGDFSESHQRRSRGLRYRRVAGLFEDHVPLRPLQAWLPNADERRRDEVLALFRAILPEVVSFEGRKDPDDGDYLFDFDGVETPFLALSDGYKAFIGWVGDLFGHLVDICPPSLELQQVGGVVLVDEIDLHLHPELQRQVVQRLAEALPHLQFVMTTHSPLIASSVQKRTSSSPWTTTKACPPSASSRSRPMAAASSNCSCRRTSGWRAPSHSRSRAPRRCCSRTRRKAMPMPPWPFSSSCHNRRRRCAR